MSATSFQPANLLRALLAAALTALIAPLHGMPPPNGEGGDLRAVFARARRGEPLRYVALGGSITQAGKGWIGDWLKARFPKSAVSVVNGGWSGTGSQLGLFRLERDVIAFRPDLVAVEFCVNDLGMPDDETVRDLETIVVRLKRLPHPPAIFFILAAKQHHPNPERHRLVARHYSLLAIDLQAATEERVKPGSLPWSALFSDEVHPNEEGHRFYTEVIGKALQPFADATAPDLPAPEPPSLPEPLSRKPLLLDAKMLPLSMIDSPGWTREGYLPYWWDCFFTGYLSSQTEGARLVLPWRGTTFGLCYAVLPSNGYFLASVDGAPPVEIPTFVPPSWVILASDLPPGEHRAAIVQYPGPGAGEPRPLKLAYALVAGETDAPGGAPAPSSPSSFSVDDLASLRFTPVTAREWSWAGPYYSPGKTGGSPADLALEFPPERPGQAVEWKREPGSPVAWIDLAAMGISPQAGVTYIKASVPSAAPRKALIRLGADYYAKLWLNGQTVRALDSAHGSPSSNVLFPVELRAGSNELLLKVVSGSRGFGFTLSVSAPPESSSGPSL